MYLTEAVVLKPDYCIITIIETV